MDKVCFSRSSNIFSSPPLRDSPDTKINHIKNCSTNLLYVLSQWKLLATYIFVTLTFLKLCTLYNVHWHQNAHGRGNEFFSYYNLYNNTMKVINVTFAKYKLVLIGICSLNTWKPGKWKNIWQINPFIMYQILSAELQIVCVICTWTLNLFINGSSIFLLSLNSKQEH